MRREERVTVQGPVKEQQPDGMSHRGDGGDAPPPPPLYVVVRSPCHEKKMILQMPPPARTSQCWSR